MALKSRLKRILRDSRTIKSRGGNPLFFALMSFLGIKRPILIPVYGLFLRPLTPDLEVAEEMIGGCFDEAIKETVMRHNFIIDAGAYIGTASVAFAKTFPKSMILALEPDRNNFSILRMNAWAHRNIIPLNVALGAKMERRHIYNRHTGEWGFTIVSDPSDCASPSRTTEVEVVTVDWLMKRYSSNGVDLLKLDIEGAEKELFDNSQAWMPKTRAIFAELHERIIPGCERSFSLATSERINKYIGEKILSLRRPPH